MCIIEERKLIREGGNTSNDINRRRIILLDSSILMYMIKSRKKAKVNLQEALMNLSEGAELAVLDTTIEELIKLRDREKGKTRIAADFALDFIRLHNIRIISVDDEIKERIKKEGKFSDLGYYDAVLIEVASEKNFSVATADMSLIKKLRKKGVTCYYPYGYRWLEVSGYQP